MFQWLPPPVRVAKSLPSARPARSDGRQREFPGLRPQSPPHVSAVSTEDRQRPSGHWSFPGDGSRRLATKVRDGISRLAMVRKVPSAWSRCMVDPHSTAGPRVVAREAT